MPDLDQTLTELVDAHRPGARPPFSALRRRSRQRHHRRQLTTVVGVVIAVVAAASLPSSLVGHRATQQSSDGGVIPYTTSPPQATDAPPPQVLSNGHGGPAIRECIAAELDLTITWHRHSADVTGDAAVAFGPYLAPATKAACRLTAHEPGLVLLGAGGGPVGPRSTLQHQPALTTAPTTPDRLISDGKPVLISLQLTGSNCVDSNTASLIGLTSDQLQTRFTGDPLPCNSGETPRDGRLVVGLPHGTDQPSALVPADRQRLEVSLQVPDEAVEGQQLRFLARLRNPTDSPISLSPCPTYMVVVGREDSDGSTGSGRVGHLNCDAAPEALSPGQELAFEMLVGDPATGQPGAHDAPELRLRWGISGPAIADATVPLRRAKPGPTPSSTGPDGADCADGEAPAPLPDPPAKPAAGGLDGKTNVVHLDVFSDCRTVRLGQPVHLRFIATGDAQQPSVSNVHIEGTTMASGPSCAVQDPAEKPEPDVTVQDLEHVYKTLGPDRITVKAETFCSRYSGGDHAELTIEVRP